MNNLPYPNVNPHHDNNVDNDNVTNCHPTTHPNLIRPSVSRDINDEVSHHSNVNQSNQSPDNMTHNISTTSSKNNSRINDVTITQQHVIQALQELSGTFSPNKSSSSNNDSSSAPSGDSYPSAPTPAAPPVRIEIPNDEYKHLRISNDDWTARIQDQVCYYDDLPKKTYRAKKVIPFGPKDAEKYYYGLSSIAIDYIVGFKKMNELGVGWKKIPKNISNVKTSIISLLLKMRKEGSNGIFHLEQDDVLKMLSNQWENDDPASILHENDKLRLFGIMMTKQEHRHIFQRIAEGITKRSHLDSPEYSYEQMFQSLCFDFNNDKIKVELPNKAEDVSGAHLLNPNDSKRIRIHRDCKYIISYDNDLLNCI